MSRTRDRMPGRLIVCATLLACVGSMATAQMRVDRQLSIKPPAPVTIAPRPGAMQALPSAHVLAVPQPVAPVVSSQPQGPTGAYFSTAMGPSIRAQNADYDTTFKVTAAVPPGSAIINVSWRYGLSPKPPGFEATLCWRDRYVCWDVTNSANGSTQAFNGRDAAQALTLHYRVKGSGFLGTPAQGEMNQIIVTYELPR